MLEFIRNLADHLALGTELPWKLILQSIQQTRDGLEAMQAHYQSGVPASHQPLADAMLEALDKLDAALETLAFYPQTQDREGLAIAVFEAEEALDLMSYVEGEIARLQQEEAEHQLA